MKSAFVHYSSRLAFACLLFTSPAIVLAQTADELPQPLTLETALQYAGREDHYQVESSEQRLQQALAEASAASSVNDVKVNLNGRLRKVGVSEVGDPDEDNDSLVSLFVRKPLYDFGKSARRDDLALLNTELRQLEKDYLIEQRELAITQKFFDVLNADNEFLRHNEDLAVGYIRFDRARENMELGLSSNIEVLELQAAYEKIRQNRYQSENMQRLTRVLLAEELGFPQSPPRELAVPELIADRTLDDNVDLLVQQAFNYSLAMKIQAKKLQIARQQIELADHTVGPRLDAELEFSDYARDASTRDDWRATIYFDVPLYAGNTEKSALDVARAQHQQALAEFQKYRSELRVEVLKLWQTILQNRIRLEGELVRQEYRDMYLDRSRAEYELEFKTDLGDAMVQYSESRRDAYQARFAIEMAWRKLEKLVGKEFLERMQTSGVSNG